MKIHTAKKHGISLYRKPCKVIAAPFDVRLNARSYDNTVAQPDIIVVCDDDKLDKVILYGSYARGDYDDESDIDIMVLADIPREACGDEYKKINKLVSRLGVEHDVLVYVDITDLFTFNKLINDLPFYMNVQSEGVLLSA